MKQIYLFLLLLCLLVSCKKAEEFSFEILNFSPKAAGCNSILTLTGRNFGSTLSGIQVSIAGVMANIVSVNDSTIVISVPIGATNGKITVNINGKTVSTLDNFTLLKGKWERISDYPGIGSVYTAGFVIKDKIYFGLGNHGGGGVDDFGEFDPKTTVWTKKANFPNDPIFGTISFTFDNIGYLAQGFSEKQFSRLSDLWAYDPAMNKWTKKASLPIIGRYFGTTFSINGKAYVGTGDTEAGGEGSSFWQYDPQSDVWKQMASFPASRRVWAVGFSISEKGYIGMGNLPSVKDMYGYNPTTNTWEQKSGFGAELGENTFISKAFTMGDKTYLRTPNQFWILDPTTFKLTELAAPWGKSTSGETAFSVGEKAYLFGGFSPVNGHSKEIWVFTAEN
jgi:N-acetylneuraminic acid mutarotase